MLIITGLAVCLNHLMVNVLVFCLFSRDTFSVHSVSVTQIITQHSGSLKLILNFWTFFHHFIRFIFVAVFRKKSGLVNLKGCRKCLNFEVLEWQKIYCLKQYCGSIVLKNKFKSLHIFFYYTVKIKCK
jgi:hypothetical protein